MHRNTLRQGSLNLLYRMFTFICFLFLTGFLLWMNTSQRVTQPAKTGLMAALSARPVQSKWLATLLFAAALLLAVCMLGPGSGIFASVVILMTAGGLIVLLRPFHYLGIRSVLFILMICFILELLSDYAGQ